MDTELLVDERIDDGRRLLSELVRAGFDVTGAFWVRTSEEGQRFLYVVSTAVARGSIGDAYRTVYAALSRLPNPSITLSDIKLIAPDNPIAIDAIAIRDRYPARIPTRHGAGRLGGVAIEEAYIYPRLDRGLNRAEVIQAVTALMNRTGPVQPSRFTLRDGSTLLAIPVGVHLWPPGPGLNVVLHEVNTQGERAVSADEIINIQ